MKCTSLLIACVLASVAMSAQEEATDYIPFVKDGKQWQIVQSEQGQYRLKNYRLMNEEVVKAGKTYMKMYQSEDDLAVLSEAGLFREEGRKVFVIDADTEKEFLAFDYSLKAGDTYETYSLDEQKKVSYKVLSVGDYREGPEIIRRDYAEKADSTETHRRYLRKWTVCRTDEESCKKTWIEGVGSLEGPLANLYDARPVSSRDYIAYVNDADGYAFLPFPFHDVFGQIHGCSLPTGAEDKWADEGHHKLTYELTGEQLHVYGEVFTQCGPNNYAYFIEEPTDDPLVHKLHFEIQEVEPLADCMALHATNFYVSGFNPNMSYIVEDNQGEEHPVINMTPQMAYRAFIEEGKVWKVGAFNSGNPVQWVEYYYFDGDTIVDGKACKQMMRQRYVTPDYADYDIVAEGATLSYVGAWYEEGQTVYAYDTISRAFQVMYDFSLDANDTLQINNQHYTIGPRQTGGINGFKGVYRDVYNHMAWKTTWMEGVGGFDGPTINVHPGQGDPAWFLMSCTVGDEVIYLNDDYEDGATPEVTRAPRHRFDFTHTIKIKPQAVTRGGTEMQSPLYGDYNDLQLGINLNPLDDAYLVRITDESGRAVYEKAVNAGSIVGLSIDISTYGKGRYTVTVENGYEAFTGEIEVRATGIDEVRGKRPVVSPYIYNLQGQRIGALQKGLNIVNGQKVYVR